MNCGRVDMRTSVACSRRYGVPVTAVVLLEPTRFTGKQSKLSAALADAGRQHSHSHYSCMFDERTIRSHMATGCMRDLHTQT